MPWSRVHIWLGDERFVPRSDDRCNARIADRDLVEAAPGTTLEQATVHAWPVDDALAALSLETAEAYAELLHSQLRSLWGFPDSPEMTMLERFQAKYLGCRYSFGYPACPRLDDQAKLWKLLQPEEIGVQLTDGFMMDPEASVSALVVHHPEAKYFGVGEGE